MYFDYSDRSKVALTLLISLVFISDLYFAVTKSLFTIPMLWSDEISVYQKRFENVRGMLPRHGLVGYIAESDEIFENDSAMKAFYLTQYTLSPTVLSPISLTNGTEAPLIIGNFHEAGSRAARLESKALAPLMDFGNGVMLLRYRNRDQTP